MRTWTATNPEWCAELTVYPEGYLIYTSWLYCDTTQPPWQAQRLTWEDFLAGDHPNMGGAIHYAEVIAYVEALQASRDGRPAPHDVPER